MASFSYENSDRKMSDIELIKKTWKFIAPYKFQLLFALFLMVVIIGFDLLNPLISEEILRLLTIQVDEVTGEKIAIDIVKVLIISGLYFVTILVHSVLIYFNAMLLQKIGIRLLNMKEFSLKVKASK